MIEVFKERFGVPRWFLAPMAGITDSVFRQLMRQLGADVVISELVSAEGLIRGGARTRELIAFVEAERPVGIQIFGSNSASLVEAARIVQEEGADFVDLNLGCPVKKVVCDGSGAAWLKQPERLRELLCNIRTAIRIPLTIKIRTGWDETNKNAHEIVRVAAEAGVAWVAIHGRTRAQGYSGQADWELIRQVTQAATVPIVGNGDLIYGDRARQMLESQACDAVMIGRGALKNPWIFLEAKGQEPDYDFLELIEKHFDLVLEFKQHTRAMLTLKKFLSWYASGLPSASSFRQEIFSTQCVGRLRAVATGYFARFNHQKVTNDGSPFLMGGHG